MPNLILIQPRDLTQTHQNASTPKTSNRNQSCAAVLLNLVSVLTTKNANLPMDCTNSWRTSKQTLNTKLNNVITLKRIFVADMELVAISFIITTSVLKAPIKPNQMWLWSWLRPTLAQDLDWSIYWKNLRTDNINTLIT